jgi:hypothetical protein
VEGPLSVTSITGALNVLRTISANQNITIEQAGGTIEEWEKLRTDQQLTREEKQTANTVYKPMVVEIFSADPTAELDPAEVASRVGMPHKQGSNSWVRHQLKQLRLTYQQSGNGKVAAD